jgi:DnaJ-class molecular chaperone
MIAGVVPRRHYDLKRLHIYDQGGRNSNSGINATIFGASSVLGMTVGSALTSIGSTAIYPYRTAGGQWDLTLKETKPTADMGHKSYVKLKDFTKQSEIDFVIRDQNTVINCIGNKVWA